MNAIFRALPIMAAALLASATLVSAPVQAADKAQQQADIRKTSQDILGELIRVEPAPRGSWSGRPVLPCSAMPAS